MKIGDNIPYYIDFSENHIESFARTFKEYFESEEIEKYGHNMKKKI